MRSAAGVNTTQKQTAVQLPESHCIGVNNHGIQVQGRKKEYCTILVQLRCDWAKQNLWLKSQRTDIACDVQRNVVQFLFKTLAVSTSNKCEPIRVYFLFQGSLLPNRGPQSLETIVMKNCTGPSTRDPLHMQCRAGSSGQSKHYRPAPHSGV